MIKIAQPCRRNNSHLTLNACLRLPPVHRGSGNVNPESADLNGVVNDRRNGNAHSSPMSFLKSGQRVSQECDACTGLSVWIGMVHASFLSTITGRGLGSQVHRMAIVMPTFYSRADPGIKMACSFLFICSIHKAMYFLSGLLSGGCNFYHQKGVNPGFVQGWCS